MPFGLLVTERIYQEMAEILFNTKNYSSCQCTVKTHWCLPRAQLVLSSKYKNGFHNCELSTVLKPQKFGVLRIQLGFCAHHTTKVRLDYNK